MRTVKEPGPVVEPDLDKTDELPVLDVVAYEAAVKDSRHLALAEAGGAADSDRFPGIDLPALIDSVQKAEARIAQQSAEQETLERELRGARANIEDSVRTAQRLETELQSVRDSVANREELLAQAMHSLGERDAALTEARRDQTQVAQQLEAGAKNSARLQGELEALRGEFEGAQSQLKSSTASIGLLQKQIERGENALQATRRESDRLKTEATEYLERLRSREWRRHHVEGDTRELDAQLGRAQDEARKFEREAQELTARVNSLSEELSQREEKIRGLNSSSALAAKSASEQISALQAAEEARQSLAAQIATQQAAHSALQAERAQLAAQLEQSAAEAQRQKTALEAEIRRGSEALAAVQGEAAQYRSKIEALEAEFAATTAKLQDLRRPADEAEAEVQRLLAALSAKTQEFEQAEAENRKLQSALERSRGALEEREFLIRRLERSANSNAQVLGRLQTSIERLGSGSSAGLLPSPSAAAAPAVFTRLDGAAANSAFTLANRTRIGRADENDLRIDSTSVSRHHAVVLSGRHTIIEDLNSTNGVLVNGRKVNRQKLKDGDLVVIGEAQFRFTEGSPLLPDVNPVSFAPSERA